MSAYSLYFACVFFFSFLFFFAVFSTRLWFHLLLSRDLCRYQELMHTCNIRPGKVSKVVEYISAQPDLFQNSKYRSHCLSTQAIQSVKEKRLFLQPTQKFNVKCKIKSICCQSLHIIRDFILE
jgi:hypothetical protein